VWFDGGESSRKKCLKISRSQKRLIAGRKMNQLRGKVWVNLFMTSCIVAKKPWKKDQLW
jgi:hypothetical protein